MENTSKRLKDGQKKTKQRMQQNKKHKGEKNYAISRTKIIQFGINRRN